MSGHPADKAYNDVMESVHGGVDYHVAYRQACQQMRERWKAAHPDVFSAPGPLREAARERWDDEWFIESVLDADGDVQHRAFHTVEVIDDGTVVREVMALDRAHEEPEHLGAFLMRTEQYLASFEDWPQEGVRP